MQNRRCGNCGCNNNYSQEYQNNYNEEEKVQPRDFEYENEDYNNNSYQKFEKCPKEHCQYFKENKYWVEECVWKKCCKFRPISGPKYN